MNKQLFCKNLCASYDSKQILQNVSFNLQQGDFICLCGPNGSGKSTFMTLLSGLQGNKIKISKAEQSPAILSDKGITELKSLSNKQKAKFIAFMQQSEVSAWDFTVREMILQGRFAYSKNNWYSEEDYAIVNEIISELELESFTERNIHSLSGGEYQKVRIAKALAQTPDFILLDEPASNLDFIYEPQLLELLKKIAKKQNIGFLISIHNINVAARFADKIALLPAQKPLLCDSVEKIFTDENLSLAFNTDLKTYIHPIYNKVQVLYEEK